MSLPFVPVIVAALLGVIALADRRLKAAAQPLRFQLAEKGEEYLRHPHASKETKEHVGFLLDSAFGMRGPLLFAVVAIPVIAMIFVVHPRSILRSSVRLNTLEPTVRTAFLEICRLHDRITLANNWLLLPLVELEIVLFMPFAIVLRSLIRGRVPETGGRDSVLSYIEWRQTQLMPKHSHAVANSR